MIIKKIIFLLSISFFFLSCSSNLRIPGESNILIKNICSEYYSIAEGYTNIKNYKKAAEYYKLAMRDKSLKPSASYKLARSYALAKDWENAEKTYIELLKIDNDNSEIKASLAYIHGMKGDTELALKEYEELIIANPNIQTYLENYINLLIFTKKMDIAEEQIEILKQRFPESVSIKDFSKKLQDYKQSIEKKSSSEAPSETPSAFSEN